MTKAPFLFLMSIGVLIAACGSDDIVVEDAKSFCEKSCAESDQTTCTTWTANFSDAYLVAFAACGSDDATCVNPKMKVAERDQAQFNFAQAYCGTCADALVTDCTTTFWSRSTGVAILSLGAARLSALQTACFPSLEKYKGSALADALCQSDFQACEQKNVTTVPPLDCVKPDN